MSPKPGAPERCPRRVTVALVAIAVACILYGYRNIQEDDSFIFYSYAGNLADGQGYVFNPGERVNATSSPLYTLALAVVFGGLRTVIPEVGIPVIAHLIGALALLGLCVALLEAFANRDDAMFACMVPFVLLANPLLVGAVGMETFLTMALAVGGLTLYSKDRRTLAAFVLGLAVLARPDVLLLAGILAAYDIFRRRRAPGIAASFAFLLPIVAWLTFSGMYFGALIPSTVAAKLAQTGAGLWGEGPVFLKGLLSGATLCSGIAYHPAAVRIAVPLLVVLAITTIAGVIIALVPDERPALVRHPMFRLIILWNVLHIVIYGVVLDAPAYSWYYTPLTLSMALFSTLCLQRTFRGAPTLSRAGVVGMLIGLTVVTLALPLATSRMPATARHATHREAAEWLNRNTPKGTAVGANDIGVLRFYYKNGPIIDGAGLVTPPVVDHLKRGDYGWYVRSYRPAYLMFIRPERSFVERFASEQWFLDQYEVATIIGGSSDGVTIWRRKPL